VSPWATGTDITSDGSANLDVAAVGGQAGQFAVRSGVDPVAPGVSTYDLVFTDVADRDAQVDGRWWDPTNRRFPNFTRWEAYMAAAVQQFRKPLFVWQIPLGNQYFDSENGSPGHTQDNRIQYFFSHLPELANAGVAALLFGAGNPGSTALGDSEQDGVTNPPPKCTVVAGVQTCADHHSIYPDDDGGFLRLAAAAYYRDPLMTRPASG
jgi:hypothetical protein